MIVNGGAQQNIIEFVVVEFDGVRTAATQPLEIGGCGRRGLLLLLLRPSFPALG